MRAEEPGATGHERGRHRGRSYPAHRRGRPSLYVTLTRPREAIRALRGAILRGCSERSRSWSGCPRRLRPRWPPARGLRSRRTRRSSGATCPSSSSIRRSATRRSGSTRSSRRATGSSAARTGRSRPPRRARHRRGSTSAAARRSSARRTEDCYRGLAAGPPTVYGAVHRRGARIVVQYWLFEPLNLWSPVVPPAANAWQAHEGDWEHVAIVLDAGGTPVTAGYAQHCGGVRIPWARVPPQRGTRRPIVYVGLGSHASYPSRACTRPIPQCWPDPKVVAGRAAGLTAGQMEDRRAMVAIAFLIVGTARRNGSIPTMSGPPACGWQPA